MADNQNTGPDREQTRQVIAGVQEVKKEQGDYNNILKESINLLKKIDRSYEDIYARVSSLDKSQISIKQISNELYKAKQKEFTVSKQLADAQKQISSDSSNRIKQYTSSQSKLSELEKRKAEYERSALKAGTEAERAAFLDKSRNVDFILNKETARNLRLKDGLSVQEAQIVALKEADKIAKAGVAFGKESLNIEKQTSKQLGISGFLVAGLATKLKTGTEAYEAMTTEARRLVEEDKKRKDLQKELSDLNIKEAAEDKKRADVAQQLVAAEQAGNQDKVKSLNAQLALMDKQKAGSQDQKKSLNEQLGLMGKERSAFSKKASVIKEGFKASKAAIADKLSDPVVLASGAVAAASGAYKLAEAGLTGIGNAAAKTGNFLAGLSEDSSNIVRGLTSGVSDLARKIPLVGGLLGGLIDGFSAILDLIIGVDDYIVKTGRQLNMTANEARAFNRSLQDAAFNSNNIYINSKKLLQSQADLTSQLGTTNILSQEILETNVALKDFAGLEADTRARIAEIAISTEQTSKGTVKGILAQIEGLKRATGIEFQSQQILKEMGAQSGYIGLQFSKYPEKMTKTLVTIKSMGLELKQLDSMADSFLDFESSISKEFEAQLLTGKEINLTKAREAFLNNDLVTAASEISRQVGTHKDFLELNRIQADSLAASFGMSRDQLGEMLRQQEILARIGGKQGDTATEQLRLAREKYQTEEKVKAALGEQNYQALTNMSVQEKIASFIEKIKQSIVDFVERTNIIEKIENFINKLSDPSTIQGILGKIRDTISTFIEIAGELLADIVEVGGDIADTLTPFSKTDYSDRADLFAAKIRAGSLDMAQRVASVGSGITLKDAAANDKYRSESGNAKAPDNSMSMAKPGETNVYLKVSNNAIEGKALAQKVDESSFESGGGQIHKVK